MKGMKSCIQLNVILKSGSVKDFLLTPIEKVIVRTYIFIKINFINYLV